MKRGGVGWLHGVTVLDEGGGGVGESVFIGKGVRKNLFTLSRTDRVELWVVSARY